MSERYLWTRFHSAPHPPWRLDTTHYASKHTPQVDCYDNGSLGSPGGRGEGWQKVVLQDLVPLLSIGVLDIKINTRLSEQEGCLGKSQEAGARGRAGQGHSSPLPAIPDASRKPPPDLASLALFGF